MTESPLQPALDALEGLGRRAAAIFAIFSATVETPANVPFGNGVTALTSSLCDTVHREVCAQWPWWCVAALRTARKVASNPC